MSVCDRQIHGWIVTAPTGAGKINLWPCVQMSLDDSFRFLIAAHKSGRNTNASARVNEEYGEVPTGACPECEALFWTIWVTAFTKQSIKVFVERFVQFADESYG